MSFMDKAKAAAERARTKAQEGIEDVQAKKELAQAYWDLGHKAYQLSSQGAITNPELEPLVERIRELEARDGSAAGAGATAEPEQATATTPPQSPA